MTNVPSIPDIPAGLDPALASFLSAVKQVMDVREGTLGDSLDRSALLRDIKLLPNITRLVSARGLADGVIRTDTTAPGAPKNLVVANRVVSNFLIWDNPTDDDLDYIEVWASLTQYRDDAERVGVATKPNATFDHQNINAHEAYYYWIRAVDQAGNYSPWSPGDALGGYLVPAPVGDSVNDLLAAMTQDSLYATVHKIVADSFQIIQPSAGFTDGRKVFVVGKMNNLPAVGIDGNMVVDGSIMARHIDADQITGEHISAQAHIGLAEGGSIMAGDGNVLVYTGDDINNHGFIVVAEDGGVNEFGEIQQGKNYMVLDSGDISFFEYVPAGVGFGASTQQSKSLKNVVSGIAKHGVPTYLGYFPSKPSITLYPQSLQCHRAAHSSQNQFFSLDALNIVETIPGNRLWQFTPQAQLTLGAATATISTGIPSVSNSSDTLLTSATTRTPDFTTRVVASVVVTSEHLVSNYFKIRQATVTIYIDNVSHVFPPVMLIGGVPTTITVEASGLTPAAHDVHVTVLCADYSLGGSYGGNQGGETTSVFHSTGSLSGGSSCGVNTLANMTNGRADSYFSTVIVAPDPIPSGWEPVSWTLDASFNYSMSGTSQMVNTHWVSASIYGVSSAYAAGTPTNQGVFSPNPKTGSFTRNIGTTVGRPIGSFGSITGDAKSNYGNASASVSASSIALHATAKTIAIVPDRTLNTIDFSSYVATLANTTVLADGDLGYLALGE